MGEGIEAETEERLCRLEALREVSLELVSERDLQRLLTLITARITRILDAERSTLYLVTETPGGSGCSKRMLVSRVAESAEEISVPLDESSIAGSVALSGRVINLEDAHRDPRFNAAFDRREGFRTRSLLTAPMRDPHGRVTGVAQAVNKKGAVRFRGEDEEMLLAFAAQASIAVENGRYLALQRSTFESLIRGQAVAIDARDHITAGHTWRVAAFAVEMGRAMGWGAEELDILEYAGLLHDQGKLGIPDEILLKPGRLSDWEFQMMRSHAAKTRAILEAVRPLFPRRLRRVPEIAASHHEKLDGSGYPSGIRGEAISPEARVVAVADIFDALTAHRPYRDPEPDATVVDLIRREALEGKLDVQVVDGLERALPRIGNVREQINERIQQGRGLTDLQWVLRGEESG
jgi:HD-GYP domain-containing protein (c-di-GMP phosphodiesterase class II)